LTVFYASQTWSLNEREKHRPSTSEDRVLRQIVEHKRDVVIGYWRRLHNEKLYDLYAHQTLFW
jgi:hypothetical protein